MLNDQANRFRPLLEEDPPVFLDRVDTPWDDVPDLEEYNHQAYKRIELALKELSPTKSSIGKPKTQGILILGEAGTGKTHLLMRVARKLSKSNHILFVRKPNNEDAVAQHVWFNVVTSLAQYLLDNGTKRSQLDDLLAHVFTKVLIPEFEKDIREGKDAEQKRRWVNHLQKDPYNLFNMLGQGERRLKHMRMIRQRTLQFLLRNEPDVDQKIARALITYCFVSREERKRVLLTWLSGQDLDEAEAKGLGLPPTWVNLDETSKEESIQQQREEQALRAIRTIGILSTYYHPLILAFDQLEGLRGDERLTQRWGDTVREIFTMTPNLLVVTCIFPSLWDEWFIKDLDRSATERIAQRKVFLEKTFGLSYGRKMLASRLESAVAKYDLPTDIYPFTEDDVRILCSQATSPRSFLQAARSLFESWLVGDIQPPPPPVVTREAIDTLLRSTLVRFRAEQRSAYDCEIPMESDFFGRVKNITETMLKFTGEKASLDKATCGAKVMPSNFILKPSQSEEPLCIAVLYSEGVAFTARMRNLNAVMQSRKEFKHAIVVRDRRCKQIRGKVGQENIEEFRRLGGEFLEVGEEEICPLNSIYDTLVAIEEHDLSVGEHVIDKKEFVQHLRSEGVSRGLLIFRVAAARSPSVERAIGRAAEISDAHPKSPANQTPLLIQERDSHILLKRERSWDKRLVPVEVLLGDTHLNSGHIGVIGKLSHDGRTVGVSFAKPQCMVLLGYMGSGKSYALGVLIENALLSVTNLSAHRDPLSVVAFNFHRNPEARFEYWGFRQPNSKPPEVAKLRSNYGAEPIGIEQLNVFGYGPELQRRQTEYPGVPTFPIRFRADELGAEHWQILMKPPTPQAEYMDVIRDIIQKLFYEERLTFKNLEKHVLTDERLSPMQRRRAENRLSFAKRWLCDDREYEWSDVLTGGVLNVFDLRMPMMSSSDALKLCLVITDLVRRTKNGVNKVVVFDEAHEYVGSKELVGELENAITQIRHDGLSFILASQSPKSIPANVFKYLLTRFIFKVTDQKEIEYIRKATPNLGGLSPQKVSNLDLEQGVCFIQTDDDCTDTLLRVPQLLSIRPRCTMHGGETVRASTSIPQQGDLSDVYEAQLRTAMQAGWDDPRMDIYDKYDENRGNQEP